MNKNLANAKRRCGYSVLCLRPKGSLCSYPAGPPYGRIVFFTSEFYLLTERVMIRSCVSIYYCWDVRKPLGIQWYQF